MPTYEYACRSCGEHLEVVQAFTDDALTTCPTCGGPLRKVFGRVGISFKGDGFYKTDSRKTSSASSQSDRSEKAEKSEKADTGTKVGAANGTGDTKPSKPAESSGDASGSKSKSKPSTPAASA